MSQAVAISPTSTNDPLSPPNLPASGRLGSHFKNRIQALMGPAASRKLASAALFVPGIRNREQALGNLSDSELVLKANQLPAGPKPARKRPTSSRKHLLCVRSRFGARWACEHSMSRSRRASLCSEVRWSSWPPAKAKR